MNYKIVWQDEFKEDGAPNPDYWYLETGGHGFGNHESQFYTDRLDNAFVKDGILTILAKKEAYEHRSYTSAKLTTFQKKWIKYCRVEVMAELPKGKGTWPAIWFLGQNFKEVGWPLCGEIDLMEHVGHDPEVFHFSLHSKTRNFFNNNQEVVITKIPGTTEGFHEFALEWDEKGFKYFVDGTCYAAFDKPKDADVELWPFDQPFYLILNIALGGSWGGAIDDQALPATFRFKYVKVYERSE